MSIEHVTLRRWVLNGETIPPGSWWGYPPDIKCPKGHIGSLRGHRIYSDGRVMPSVVCHDAACGWHVWATLADFGVNHA